MKLYNENTDDYDKEIELTPWTVNWIIEGSKVREGYDPFGLLAERTAKTNEAIARADAIINELRATLNIDAEADPFEPCDPPTEPKYDEYQEWQQMTEQLRRGDA